MSMREEFEAWFPVPSNCEGFNGGFYFYTDVRSGKEKRHPHHKKWIVWQASREALEVELPRVCASDDPFDLKRDIEYELEQAGVRVKP